MTGFARVGCGDVREIDPRGEVAWQREYEDWNQREFAHDVRAYGPAGEEE